MATRLNGDDAAALMRIRGLEPLEPYTNANHKWLCSCTQCGREVRVPYNSIRRGTRGCRACSGYAIPPEVAVAQMLAAGFEPLEPYTNARSAWRCRCLECGRESGPSHYSVARAGTGCAWCAGLRIEPGDAEAELLAAGFTPLAPYPGSNEPWLCLCKVCGRETSPTLNSVRSSSASGCKFCSGIAVDPIEAAQVMLENLLEPLEPYSGSHRGWRCLCMSCGREVSPSYKSVRSGNSGCGYCSRKRVDPADAVQRMVEAGVEPLEPFPGVSLPWRCKCSRCHRVITPRCDNVSLGKDPCKYCSGKEIDAETAEAIMRGRGLVPLTPYPGAQTPWSCRCENCGNEPRPRLINVKRLGTGCKYCADYGLDWADPTILYLITQRELGAHKVGLAKANRVRLRSHRSHGWEVFGEVTLPTGDLAHEVEQAVLIWWRADLGLPPFLSQDEMPRRGATETVDALGVSLVDTWRMIQALVRGAGAGP